MIKRCEFCGKAYVVPACRRRRRFCSQECQIDALNFRHMSRGRPRSADMESEFQMMKKVRDRGAQRAKFIKGLGQDPAAKKVEWRNGIRHELRGTVPVAAWGRNGI